MEKKFRDKVTDALMHLEEHGGKVRKLASVSVQIPHMCFSVFLAFSFLPTNVDF